MSASTWKQSQPVIFEWIANMPLMVHREIVHSAGAGSSPTCRGPRRQACTGTRVAVICDRGERVLLCCLDFRGYAWADRDAIVEFVPSSAEAMSV